MDISKEANRLYLVIFLLLSCFLSEARKPKKDPPPNVILVLTDDQGIGDLGCHGNPWLKTPHIDAFYEEAVRFTDFHVSPVCTPTRSAIITGRYPINNGAWATYKGRDALTGGATTMAQLFRDNGYQTGIFGKWHLGDNYPVRPTDCGFDVAVHHMSGGVGELSDYWGNNYFDDVYYVNNEARQFEGYCTDVWFREAMNFMTESKEKPFFVYLSTNAPHVPLYVDKKYAEPFKSLVGTEIVSAEYFGMVANIDENFGRLEKFLKQNELANNTILIFMTDNGATNGVNKDGTLGYNMGFRGRKGDKIEGGHRVPFFIRWIDGRIKGGWDIHEIAAHVDLIPTLAGLCQLSLPQDMILDGLDLTPLLRKEQSTLKERYLYVHHRQDWRPPLDLDQTCLIKEQWRLVNGTQLYDINKDRMQMHDISGQHPGLVKEMLDHNSAFVSRAKSNSEYQEFPAFVVGNSTQPEIKLTIQHAIGEDRGFWKSEQVAEGLKNKNNTHAIEVETAGRYRISCCRWPRECPGPILGIPRENPKNWFRYQAISPQKVRIQIANQIHEKPISQADEEVVFEVNLEQGKTFLVNDFMEGKERYGVYYTYIELLESTE